MLHGGRSFCIVPADRPHPHSNNLKSFLYATSIGQVASISHKECWPGGWDDDLLRRPWWDNDPSRWPEGAFLACVLFGVVLWEWHASSCMVLLWKWMIPFKFEYKTEIPWLGEHLPSDSSVLIFASTYLLARPVGHESFNMVELTDKSAVSEEN